MPSGELGLGSGGKRCRAKAYDWRRFLVRPSALAYVSRKHCKKRSNAGYFLAREKPGTNGRDSVAFGYLTTL